jgi:hypothetical protein
MFIYLGTFERESPNCQIMNLATLGVHNVFHFAFKSKAFKENLSPLKRSSFDYISSFSIRDDLIIVQPITPSPTTTPSP